MTGIGHNNPPKQKRTRQKPGSVHYVNSKDFTLALDDYSRKYRAAEEAGEELPIMSRYLGDCLIRMANRLSGKPQFRGYTYRDEMIQDAILGACKYMHKFNGDRFDNGFAYVTQILFSHMIQTIKKEKKKYELNIKLIQQAEMDHMDHKEFQVASNEHARKIADQKLGEMEENKQVPSSKKGFRLKTGWTKESREAYDKGKALVRDEDEDNKDD